MFKIAISIIILSFSFLIVSCNESVDSEEKAIFQSVYADSLFESSTFITKKYVIGKSPEFIIVNNVLYLKIQISYNKNNMYMVADTIIWNNSRLDDLICRNQELIPLLPNKNSKNRGIAWVKGP